MIDNSEATLDQIAQELMAAHPRTVVPLYPQIFVRVLPKEARKGLIYLPEKSSKPVYEALVLRTYVQKKVDGNLVTASVKPGDHILFEHWAGLPIPFLDESRYRVLREENIHAVIHYETGMSGEEYLESCGLPETDMKVLRQYDLIRKDVSSLTTSGA